MHHIGVKTHFSNILSGNFLRYIMQAVVQRLIFFFKTRLENAVAPPMISSKKKFTKKFTRFFFLESLPMIPPETPPRILPQIPREILTRILKGTAPGFHQGLLLRFLQRMPHFFPETLSRISLRIFLKEFVFHHKIISDFFQTRSTKNSTRDSL